MKQLDPEKVAAFRYDKGSVGCLLTHGFSGSPFEMRELGEYLAEKGVSVLCKPLPGHGTTPHDMLNKLVRLVSGMCRKPRGTKFSVRKGFPLRHVDGRHAQPARGCSLCAPI